MTMTMPGAAAVPLNPFPRPRTAADSRPSGTLAARAAALRSAAVPRTRTLAGVSSGVLAGLYPGRLPRTPLIEGITVGVCAATGLGLTALVMTMWAWCARRFTHADRAPRRAGWHAVAGFGGLIVAAGAWSVQSQGLIAQVSWTGQPDISADTLLPASHGAGSMLADWAMIMVVAAAVATILIGAGVASRAAVRAVWAHGFRPGRDGRNDGHHAVAVFRFAVAFAVVVMSIGMAAGRIALPAVQDRLAQADSATESGITRPLVSTRSGGPGSLVAWETLGVHGRRFVADTTTPGSVRAYAGLQSAEDPATRAALAADDMVRAGGLAKSAVVVTIPTGSGWVDGAAAAAFERHFAGDVAEVGMQYSNAPSWVGYVFDPAVADDAAGALVDAVSERIASLPAADRPALYVYGESLGAAAGSDAVAESPVARGMLCGALWVGPPAEFDDPVPRRSTLVTNETDPVPHWSPSLAVAPPGGQDPASPPWIPGVSFLQASIDIVVARSGPAGTGHVYGHDQVRDLPRCDGAPPVKSL